MAIVLLHGVLCVGGAVQHIWRYLIVDKNITKIQQLVFLLIPFKVKAFLLASWILRNVESDVLLIDASQHFEKTKQQKYLRDAEVN